VHFYLPAMTIGLAGLQISRSKIDRAGADSSPEDLQAGHPRCVYRTLLPINTPRAHTNQVE